MQENHLADEPEIHELLAQASRLWAETTGEHHGFSELAILKNSARSLVVRCNVKAGQGLGSVIIKQFREDTACGFTEWASLDFLSKVPEARSIVPHFYGGDVENRFFLMEDFGESHTLEAILSAGEPVTLENALRDLARQMARLQGATLGRQDEYAAIRLALPQHEGVGCEVEALRWREGVAKIWSWFQVLSLEVPGNFELALQYVQDTYAHSQDFLAFTHGDPAPSNNHFGSSGARLLDFEYGGFRHALYDITAWQVLCPLPQDFVRLMRESFRTELSKSCVAALDSDRFALEWATLCAFRALAILTWIPPDILNENRIWAGNWTMRQAVLVAMLRLAQVASPFSELGCVAGAARLLSEAFLTRWPEYRVEEAQLLPQWIISS